MGKERKLYNFHKALLTSRCPFFEGCLNPSFPEGASSEVVLEDDSAETFDHFFHWIYFQDLKVTAEFPFAAVYILADKFCMEEFKNATVDAVRVHNCPYVETVQQCNLLVSHNLSNSLLTQFFIRRMTSLIVLNATSFDMATEEFLKAFGKLLGDAEVLGRFLCDLEDQLRDKELEIFTHPSDWGRCLYHEHKRTACRKDDEAEDDEAWWQQQV